MPYLEDYLMEKCCTWDNGSVCLKDWPCKIYMGQWPIFHGPLILLYVIIMDLNYMYTLRNGERGGSVVECRTPEREVRGSKPTAAMLCPWARHFTPRKYWLITQEAVAPSRHDWKIVDWYVKPQHKQTNKTLRNGAGRGYSCPFGHLLWCFLLPLLKYGSIFLPWDS